MEVGRGEKELRPMSPVPRADVAGEVELGDGDTWADSLVMVTVKDSANVENGVRTWRLECTVGQVGKAVGLWNSTDWSLVAVSSEWAAGTTAGAQ